MEKLWLVSMSPHFSPVSNELNQNAIEEYLKLTTLCMTQSYFQVEGKYFKQTEGTAMGNPLSPFFAEVFMGHFETDCKKKFAYFPKLWLRYVDDIFAIFDTKRCDLATFILQLNSQFQSIKFTHEVAKDHRLPFLDTAVINNNNILEIDIYRKETSTFRYITNDSKHCNQHKLASFNFLVHRLLNFPLTKVRYENELKTIKHIARCNEYDTKTIDRLIQKKSWKKLIFSNTQLKSESNDKKYVSIPFDPILTKGLETIFNTYDLKLVFTNTHSLGNILNKTKDKDDKLQKSGIYSISCNDCELVYYGQTRRTIGTRFKEHISHVRYNREEKSSVASHILNSGHSINISNLSLEKVENNYRKLNAWESIIIHKNKHRKMNSDLGPNPNSNLYSLLH